MLSLRSALLVLLAPCVSGFTVGAAPVRPTACSVTMQTLTPGAPTRFGKVTLRFGEELTADGAVLSPMRTGSLYEDHWTLSAGHHVRVQHHEYIEGRYGELLFESSCGPLLGPPTVGMWVVRASYDQGSAAQLRSSSPALAKVWELARYTSEATALDLYSDSNARQRSADCMADDNTAMRLAYATSAQLALQRYAMQQALTFCGSLTASGGGAGSAQSCHVEWSVLALVMVRDDALHTGDLSFAQRHFDALVPSAKADLITAEWGLVRSDDVLIDWPPGQRDRFVLTEYNAVANAWVYRGLKVLEELATWLDRPEDAARHRQTAATLRAAISKHMWNGTAWCDGICQHTPHTAFHSSVYMLSFGAADDAHALGTWKYVRSRITPPFGAEGHGDGHTLLEWPPPPPAGSKLGMPCSSYVAQFAIHALYVGRPDDGGRAALRVLTSDAKHSWLSMLESGATTTMEAWSVDEKPNLTWSHPWSASPGFLIPWLLFGLQCLQVGCGRLHVQPAPGDLDHGEYSLPTVRGPVTLAFDQTGGSALRVWLTLPSGVEADVVLGPRGVCAGRCWPGSCEVGGQRRVCDHERSEWVP